MKRLIVILGMRSGSSVTARISQCMGAYLGESHELLGAASSNPDGHFENIEAVRINKRILRICGREWYSLENPELDYHSSEIQREVKGIQNLVCRLLEKNDTALIKDPRICILLPLWDKALKELGIEVQYIWVFRNPLEVMESLRKRDGYSSRHGVLLWIHYNLSVLKFLQGKEYLSVSYRDILERPQTLEELGRLFGRKPDDTLKWELKQIIKQKYCHSKYSYQDVKDTQDSLLSDLYGALLEKREAEADVAELEALYRMKLAKTEASFMDYETLDNFRCLEEKEIIIYGAGNYGRRAAEMLRQLGILQYNFCDRDPRKQGTDLVNGKVFPITEIENKKNLLVIVAIENIKARKEMEYTLAYMKDAAFLSFFALEKDYRFSSRDFTSLLSGTERIYTWYKELSRRANKVRSACKSSVLVYQNGKVASSSIFKGLQKAGIKSAHVHRFFFKNDIVGELILGEEQKEFIQTSNFLSFQNPQYVKAVKEEMKCKKIITLVREPISVDLATVFQWIELGTTDQFFARRMGRGASFRQVVTELMVKIHNRQFRWFDEELKELTGIDVYSYPFSKEEGYTIISEKGTEILLIKVEKLSNLTSVIQKFVGNIEFELLNENVGENKEYSHLFKAMRREIQLPAEYVEQYYNNNLHMNHFYSKEEQREFLDKWKRNL